MLTVASLLAAMTIAGAFWVGVLAARRLRDWGEGRRALEEGGPAPLALAAVSGAPPDDDATRRVRALVAQRLKDHQWTGDRALPRASGSSDRREPSAGEREDARLSTLRVGDIVVLDGVGTEVGSDFIVEGVINLSNAERIAHAQVVIDNSGSEAELLTQLKTHWDALN